MPAADAVVVFVNIRDIAAVAAKLLVDAAPSGRTYALTGPDSKSFAQVVSSL